MQRCNLHFRGVKIPKLGSLQDRVFREVVQHEKLLEAKKTEFLMLLTSTNPMISDEGKHREWIKTVKSVWKGYVGLLMNIDIPDQTQDEQLMLEYYDKVVKNLRPRMRKTKDGKLEVKGLDVLHRP